jgi:hypothetical protein
MPSTVSAVQLSIGFYNGYGDTPKQIEHLSGCGTAIDNGSEVREMCILSTKKPSLQTRRILIASCTGLSKSANPKKPGRPAASNEEVSDSEKIRIFYNQKWSA